MAKRKPTSSEAATELLKRRKEAKDYELGIEICRCLGLDPDKTSRLVLTFEPGGIAKVDVTQHVGTKELKKVELILRHYHLAPGPSDLPSPSTGYSINNVIYW